MTTAFEDYIQILTPETREKLVAENITSMEDLYFISREDLRSIGFRLGDLSKLNTYKETQEKKRQEEATLKAEDSVVPSTQPSIIYTNAADSSEILSPTDRIVEAKSLPRVFTDTPPVGVSSPVPPSMSPFVSPSVSSAPDDKLNAIFNNIFSHETMMSSTDPPPPPPTPPMAMDHTPPAEKVNEPTTTPTTTTKKELSIHSAPFKPSSAIGGFQATITAQQQQQPTTTTAGSAGSSGNNNANNSMAFLAAFGNSINANGFGNHNGVGGSFQVTGGGGGPSGFPNAFNPFGVMGGANMFGGGPGANMFGGMGGGFPAAMGGAMGGFGGPGMIPPMGIPDFPIDPSFKPYHEALKHIPGMNLYDSKQFGEPTLLPKHLRHRHDNTMTVVTICQISPTSNPVNIVSMIQCLFSITISVIHETEACFSVTGIDRALEDRLPLAYKGTWTHVHRDGEDRWCVQLDEALSKMTPLDFQGLLSKVGIPVASHNLHKRHRIIRVTVPVEDANRLCQRSRSLLQDRDGHFFVAWDYHANNVLQQYARWLSEPTRRDGLRDALLPCNPVVFELLHRFSGK